MISNILNMQASTINLLRDLSIKLNNDRKILESIDLAKLVYISRPNKWTYERLTSFEKIYQIHQQIKLKNIFFLPIGFRCFTKSVINEKFKFIFKTLPFDVGFFPPASVISVFENPHINLDFNDRDSSAPCIKYEYYNNNNIKFLTSSYEEIDSYIQSCNKNDINHYLDTTLGYYTLDKTHKFILAHYNWHKISDSNYNQGVTDPEKNLQNINIILNRRIKRMLQILNDYKIIIISYHNPNCYEKMFIDEDEYDLTNIDILKKYFKDKFGEKCFVVKIKETSLDDIIDILDHH